MKYVILFAVCLFLFLGCIEGEPQVTEPIENTTYVCDDGTIVSSPEFCPEVDGESDSCLASSDSDACFYSLAISRNDASLCTEIKSLDPQEEYNQMNCAAEIALSKGDYEECEKIEDRYSCYSKYAIETSDYSVCEMIIEGVFAREECMSALLTASSDWDSCDDISDFKLMDECYYDAAIDTGNMSYCGLISPRKDYINMDCYADAGALNNDFSGCKNLQGVDVEMCYVKYALNTGDSSVCEQINMTELKVHCMNMANMTTENMINNTDNFE